MHDISDVPSSTPSPQLNLRKTPTKQSQVPQRFRDRGDGDPFGNRSAVMFDVRV